MDNLFSEKRIEFYKLYAQEQCGDENKYLNYYLKNIKESMKLYPYLSLLEVTLRNKIASHLNENFGDWYNENSNFNQFILQSRHSKFISEANSRLHEKDREIEKNAIISELTLGFWVTLFKKQYSEPIWNRFKYKRLFSGEWSKFSIAQIHHELEGIRFIRNRIFHYEQILTRNPQKVLEKIIFILTSLDSEGKLDNCLKELENG